MRDLIDTLKVDNCRLRELRNGLDKLIEELASGSDNLQAENAALKQRIADAEKQKPWVIVALNNSTGRWTELSDSEVGYAGGTEVKLYSLPPILPDVAELQQKLSASEADAEAFRALATLPSLWQLTLMFGPHFQMDTAWGTGKGIEVSENIVEGDKVRALRNLVHTTLDAVNIKRFN